jgi:glycosyltransferase involved in cell wall biosynthesis
MVKKTLLVVGDYIEEYPRNQVLFDALNKIFVVHKINLHGEKYKKYFFLKKLLAFKNKTAFIFLVKPAQRFVFLVLLFKIFYKGKIIFDAFTSIYDSFVYDRKLVKKKSLKAFYYYLLDFFSCRAADILVFDTLEHKDYFLKTFKVKKKKKFIIFPVAVNLEIIKRINPKDRPVNLENKFIVLFYGYYIPLQGVEYIIKAADILRENRNIHFVLIGSGQTRREINRLYRKLKLNNITFLNRIPYVDLIKHIKMSDVCLGIFGGTEKSLRVIPNKVIDYMACGKIVITGRSPAMERYFQNSKDVIYCNMADEKDLAQKIIYAHNNYKELQHIKNYAQKKVKQYFSMESLIKAVQKEF